MSCLHQKSRSSSVREMDHVRVSSPCYDPERRHTTYDSFSSEDRHEFSGKEASLSCEKYLHRDYKADFRVFSKRKISLFGPFESYGTESF